MAGRDDSSARSLSERPRRVGILGSFEWHVKQESLRRFLGAADPIFNDAGLKLHVAGNIPDEFRSELEPGLLSTRLLGWVDDSQSSSLDAGSVWSSSRSAVDSSSRRSTTCSTRWRSLSHPQPRRTAARRRRERHHRRHRSRTRPRHRRCRRRWRSPRPLRIVGSRPLLGALLVGERSRSADQRHQSCRVVRLSCCHSTAVAGGRCNREVSTALPGTDRRGCIERLDCGEQEPFLLLRLSGLTEGFFRFGSSLQLRHPIDM